MTFRKGWFSNKVISTEAYSVEIVDPASILYTDQEKRLD